MENTPMETEAFRLALAADGYDEILTKTLDANLFVDAHSHPFDVRALVLAGQLTLVCDGVERVFKAGDIAELARDVVHTEQYGPDGYTFLLGRRHP